MLFSEQYFCIVLPLNPENWLLLIRVFRACRCTNEKIFLTVGSFGSGIPCVSMKERRNFVDDFPPVDFVIFTERNFEYLSKATNTNT